MNRKKKKKRWRSSAVSPVFGSLALKPVLEAKLRWSTSWHYLGKVVAVLASGAPPQIVTLEVPVRAGWLRLSSGGGLSHSEWALPEVAVACPYGEDQWQESWVTTEHLCCAGHAMDMGEEHNQEEGVGWVFAPDGKEKGILQVRWQGRGWQECSF